jgi:hypothetical protein
MSKLQMTSYERCYGGHKKKTQMETEKKKL